MQPFPGGKIRFFMTSLKTRLNKKGYRTSRLWDFSSLPPHCRSRAPLGGGVRLWWEFGQQRPSGQAAPGACSQGPGSTPLVPHTEDRRASRSRGLPVCAHCGGRCSLHLESWGADLTSESPKSVSLCQRGPASKSLEQILPVLQVPGPLPVAFCVHIAPFIKHLLS